MGSRWYSIAVVALWLATMTWLMLRKVLPPLLIGDPPNYQRIIANEGTQPPVGWYLSLNGRPLGWALSTMIRMPNQTVEVRSRVHFDHVPIDQLIPAWLRNLVPAGGPAFGKLEMEAQNVMTIDPLGRLVDFDSALRTKATQSVIRLRGAVDGTKVRLAIHAGDFAYEPEITLRPEAVLGDNLSPQVRLPGLRLGQSWTMPSYSPMYPLNNPIEILQARVEERVPIVWGGRTEDVWLVVYRTDAAQGPGSEKNVRTRLWVRPDGTVLRQQVQLFDAALLFNRMSEEETSAMPGFAEPFR